MIAGEMRAVAELNAEHGFMPILLRGLLCNAVWQWVCLCKNSIVF